MILAMYGSLCKRLAICPLNWWDFSYVRTTQLTHMPFPRNNVNSYIFVKQFSSASKDELCQSFLVSYLINSCGLSSERAVCISLRHGVKLKFDSAKKPDSILSFFRNHGFADTHISKIISSDPLLLSCQDPEKILLPKFEFFYSIGFTKQDLPQFLHSNPTFLRRSIRDHVIPLYSIIRSVLHTDAKVVATMKRAGWGLHRYVNRDLGPNVAYLKEAGVPRSKIALLLRGYPSDLLLKHAEFCKSVDKVIDLGFDASMTVFVVAVHALNKGYNFTRDRCSKIYREWDWSDEDIVTAFRRHPGCLLLSEKKLTRTLDFLVNKMGCRAGQIAKCPSVLFRSLERTIIPRCSVVQVLLIKGLKKDWSLSYVLSATEKIFLERFVTRYYDIVPQLMSVYQQKLLPYEAYGAEITEAKQPQDGGFCLLKAT
ncbi:hypothetical protein Nepgr_017198 [Nepenthes gracilis]|uniref:Uncharacterized protein n=1 Tax=Nepenthes gracilis TaxID=150966 RepID=A0AAD3XRY5_NEPGR|nr:hypothetical protein Nepgr_017198 [Nepenthes gracilis]